ncbi:hypothetical protein BH20ACI2_BH20ACI2_14400 [soil metagenome]
MTLKLLFGSVQVLTLQEFSPKFLMLLIVMGLTQYAVNSGFVSGLVALRAGDGIWETWHKNFLWTSMTYFAGAFAAGIIAKASGSGGVFAFVATAPIIAIIYFTYRTYLQNVEAAATQAQNAQTEQLSEVFPQPEFEIVSNLYSM